MIIWLCETQPISGCGICLHPPPPSKSYCSVTVYTSPHHILKCYCSATLGYHLITSSSLTVVTQSIASWSLTVVTVYTSPHHILKSYCSVTVYTSPHQILKSYCSVTVYTSPHHILKSYCSDTVYRILKSYCSDSLYITSSHPQVLL